MRKILLACLLLPLAFAFTVGPIVLTGCATFQDKAGRVLASTALTVDASMKGWGAYVARGWATHEQENQVRQAYGKYQLAMDAASSAYSASAISGDQSIWQRAQAALIASAGSLTALVDSFTTATPPPAR